MTWNKIAGPLAGQFWGFTTSGKFCFPILLACSMDRVCLPRLATPLMLLVLIKFLLPWVKALQSCQKIGHLADTITFIISDHGLHMGPYFMFSEAGHEERLFPVMYAILPVSYLKQHPEIRQVCNDY